MVTRARLAIAMPELRSPAAADRIRNLAVEAGWLPDPKLDPTRKDKSLCASMQTSKRLPRVELPDVGVTVDARAVARLTGETAGDHASDGLELAVALICLNACAKPLSR